jgi:oligoribonuclease NrnB/cAMP/cGMP phosphodiesterase (DHH superfamily)
MKLMEIFVRTSKYGYDIEKALRPLSRYTSWVKNVDIWETVEVDNLVEKNNRKRLKGRMGEDNMT